MTKSALYFLAAALLIAAFPAPAHAEGGCYKTGEGPIMSCYEGNRRIEVRKPFRYKDGNYYSWDHNSNSYCYRNEHDNPRCIQNWELPTLQCFEADGGQLVCK